MATVIWNPWHGCDKYSEGCKHCYVYRRDTSIGKDASVVTKNAAFDLPIRKNRNGEYKITPGTLVYCCMTSDFFLDKADQWRDEIWDMMRIRQDLHFMIITKRIIRFNECIPDDWKDGWDHLSFVCTIENQHQCDLRFPVFRELPIKHKFVACEPLLTDIDMSAYLDERIIRVIAGGESGAFARVCDYRWVTHLREQCLSAKVGFTFKQTGARFLKDGRIFYVPRKLQHDQAKKAGIDLGTTKDRYGK